MEAMPHLKKNISYVNKRPTAEVKGRLAIR